MKTKDQLAQERYSKNYADLTTAQQFIVDDDFDGQEEPKGTATGSVTTAQLQESGATFPAPGVAIAGGYEYRQQANGQWAAVSKVSSGSTAAAKPQGGTTTAELTGLGAKITGGTAVVTNEDGSKDRYVKNPDGTWDYRSTEGASKTSDRPLASSASQAIAGASSAAQKKAGQQGNATGGPSTTSGAQVAASAMGGLFGRPNIGANEITAPQSGGVIASDLIGQLPGFLTGSNPLGQSAYPIVAGANPTQGQDQGFGFTPIPGTELAQGGAGLQFGGQLGDVNMGVGMNAGQVLGSAGYKPSGNSFQDMLQALALQNERQKILSQPSTGEIAKNLGTNQFAAAQTVMDKILGLQGVNYGQAGTYRDPNTGQLKDSYGMTLMETNKASNVDPRTGVTGKVTPTANLAGESTFDAANFLSPVDLYRDEFAAGGYRGITTQPTRFHTSETGQPEMVTVQPINEPFADPFGTSGPKPVRSYDGTNVAPMLDYVDPFGVQQGPPAPAYSGYTGNYQTPAMDAEALQDANRLSFWDWLRNKAMGESVYLQGQDRSRRQGEAQQAAGLVGEGAGRPPRIGPNLRPEPVLGPRPPFAQLMEQMFWKQGKGRTPAAKPVGMQ